MALMPVERLSHSTGIFVYFGLGVIPRCMCCYLRFEGLIPLPGNIYLRFRGWSKHYARSIWGICSLKSCGLRDVYTLLPTP